MAAAKSFQVTLAPQKITKNTVVFSEIMDESDILAVSQLGTIYVPKATLASLGWQGNRLTFNVTMGDVVRQES